MFVKTNQGHLFLADKRECKRTLERLRFNATGRTILVLFVSVVGSLITRSSWPLLILPLTIAVETLLIYFVTKTGTCRKILITSKCISSAEVSAVSDCWQAGITNFVLSLGNDSCRMKLGEVESLLLSYKGNPGGHRRSEETYTAFACWGMGLYAVRKPLFRKLTTQILDGYPQSLVWEIATQISSLTNLDIDYEVNQVGKPPTDNDAIVCRADDGSNEESKQTSVLESF